jgi:hypothetical protein
MSGVFPYAVRCKRCGRMVLSSTPLLLSGSICEVCSLKEAVGILRKLLSRKPR